MNLFFNLNQNIHNQINNIHFSLNNSPLQIHRVISTQEISNNQLSFPAINQGQNLSLSVDSFDIKCQSVKPLFCILKCLYFCLKNELAYLINILIIKNIL